MYVCMYHVTYCKVRWSLRFQVSLISMLSRYRGEQEREPCLCLLALAPCSLLLVPCSLLSTGTGTVPGTGTGAGYGVPGYLDTIRVGPRNGLGQGGSPSLGREAGVQVGQAGRQAWQGRSRKSEATSQAGLSKEEQRLTDGVELSNVRASSDLSCVPLSGSLPVRGLPCPPALQVQVRATACWSVL